MACCRFVRGPRPRGRRCARAARQAGSGGAGRPRTSGPPGTRPGGRRPRPAASIARRKYRHRDADRVPSGEQPAAWPWSDSRTIAGNEAPEATGDRAKSLDVISVLRSCWPLRARPTVRATRGTGQRGYPRTSAEAAAPYPRTSARLWKACGRRRPSRPSRTSRSSADRSSPRTAAPSSDRPGPARCR